MTETTDDDGGSSYRRINELGGRFFSGVYEGERRRFYVAEHVNIGKGYMLSMEGVRGTVSECRVTNIERAEPFGIWRRMHGG